MFTKLPMPKCSDYNLHWITNNSNASSYDVNAASNILVSQNIDQSIFSKLEIEGSNTIFLHISTLQNTSVATIPATAFNKLPNVAHM